MEIKDSVVLPESPATPPSIARFLTSSHGAPDDLESRIAKEHIHHLESHLTSVQNLISVECVAELARSIESHKAIMSPIRRLPNELMVEIFSLAARAAFHWWDISETREPVTSQAPWVFTHVCQLWAELALGSRALWSRIFVDLDAIDEEAQGVVSILKLFLERSGILPLNVKIFYEGFHLTPDARLETHRAFDVALRHVERWGNVHLYLAWPLLLSNIAAMRGHFSTLKTLTVFSTLMTKWTRATSRTHLPLRPISLPSKHIFMLLACCVARHSSFRGTS
ncbi:hypothetical protein FB45DRAFT_211778 [Roridomyces roridus]|uniref:F-box domain-containing protein n=1 Tax=Roridomyces roridus TaxID=1738132 RepID=A0AAD7G0N9_9AGAR|nr:hypothetical protein FB45DRAFT_211778 [Roridomyces roridus]